jgi:hypothetical protein
MANATSGFCVVGLVLVAAGSGFGAPKGVRTAVDVYLSSGGNSWLLEPGTPLASAIFKKIGVRLSWHAGELRAGQGAIGIRIVGHAPKSASSNAVASAQLLGSSGAEITVYEDRVRRLLAENRGLAGVATGYVLAHELAHVMQGVAHHSESGILKAQWSSDDWNAMMGHKLAFADSDVELIHRGLALQSAHRRSGLAAEAGSGSPVVSSLAER